MPTQIQLVVREAPLRTADRHDELVDGLIGNRSHLVVGAVLNRMLDEESCWVKTQGRRLRLGRVDEGGAGDKHTRESAAFKVGDVMHTA